MSHVLPPSLVDVTLIDVGRGWRRESEGQAPGPVTNWMDLEHSSVVVLLGQPGYGKTSELYRWHLATEASAWVDLGDVGDFRSLFSQLRSADVVFVDGCEEYSGPAAPLFKALAEARADGRKIRLASRSSWWAVHRDLAVTRLAPVDVVELQPLGAEGAAQLLTNSGYGDHLVKLATSRGAGALVQNPRFLLGLAKAVERTGEIPETRLLVYEVLAAIGAEEHNPALRRSHHRSSAAVLAAARWFAAASLLTRRSVFTDELTVPDDGRLSTDILFAGVSLEGIEGSVTSADVFGSHLMTVAENGFRFVDQSITEYLAASLLSSRIDGQSDSKRRWQLLLTTTVGGQSYVPPSLRGVAAWASELSDIAFDVVYTTDSSVLLENDFAAHPTAGAARLFEQLIADDELLGRARFSPALLRATYDAADGAHTFAAILNAVGRDADRRRILEFIGSAELREFDDELASIIIDPAEGSSIRYWAATSLSADGDPDALARIKERLLNRSLPVDPDNRILGLILSAVWPRLIGAEEMFQLLGPPTSRGLLEYEHFLSTKLVPGLTAEGLPFALAWIPALLDDRWSNTYLQKQLATSIAGSVGISLKDDLLSGILRASLVRELPLCLPLLLEEVRGEELSELRSALSPDEAAEIVQSSVLLAAEDRLGRYDFMQTAAWLAEYHGATDLVRVAFGQVRSAGPDHLALWLLAFGRLLRPERDRDVIDELLALEGPERARFAELLDPLELAAVPAFLRRRNRKPDVDPAKPHSLEAVLRREITWEEYVFYALSAPSMIGVLPLGDGDMPELDLVDIEELGVLLGEVLRAGPGGPPNDPHEVSVRELAFAHALDAMHGLGKSSEIADELLVDHLDALVRCDTFVRTPTYETVLRVLVARAAPRVQAILTRRLHHAAGCSRCNGRIFWLRHYPADFVESLGADVLSVCVDVDVAHERRANMLADAARFVSSLTAGARQILDAFVRTPSFGAAVVALVVAGMPFADVELVELEDEEAKAVVTALASSRGDNTYGEALRGMTSEQLGDLFELATRLFERTAIPQSGAGVPIGWDVDRLREDCLQILASDPEEGVVVLSRLAGRRPLTALLGRPTMQQLIDRVWNPLTPAEFVALLLDRRANVVRNAADLLGAAVQALEAYQESLKDVGGGAELLWAAASPRLEADLSIDLARFLRQHFRGHNVLLNREVELKPASTALEVNGERSDILVQAMTHDGNTLSLVVELKGSWNPSKYSGYKSQLLDRYLAHPSVDAGLHVVFWFDRESWDEKDGRRNRSPASPARVAAELRAKKPTSSKPIEHFVVDAGLSVRTDG